MWRQVEVFLGLQQDMFIHPCPGYVSQFYVTGQSYTHTTQNWSCWAWQDKTLPELNAEMAWSPLNWDLWDSS